MSCPKVDSAPTPTSFAVTTIMQSSIGNPIVGKHGVSKAITAMTIKTSCRMRPPNTAGGSGESCKLTKLPWQSRGRKRSSGCKLSSLSVGSLHSRHKMVHFTHFAQQKTIGLDWIEQGLTSPPTQYRLSGRHFYRSKDPTNSIKVLNEKLASHRPEETSNPPGASHRVTSEPLKKKKNRSQWVKPSETKPLTAGRPVQVLYRSCNNRCCYATTYATQHFSKTGLGILYPLCTKPTSMMKCGQGVVCVEGGNRKRRKLAPEFRSEAGVYF